jgi:cytochrome c biogenesis protein CcmG, thiol:disulfide interchange protein DsbE
MHQQSYRTPRLGTTPGVCEPAHMRRFLPLLLAAALLGGCGDDPQSAAPPQAEADRALAGAPAPLASLHREASRLLPGGAEAFRARLRTLRGHPVVVNKWASWCDPCRQEFPYFQKLSVELGREVGFIGVDAQDNTGDAREFLREYPVSFPSYEDPDQEVAQVFKGHLAFPATAFYDRSGRLSYVKQGGYATEARLREDIERYAR